MFIKQTEVFWYWKGKKSLLWCHNFYKKKFICLFIQKKIELKKKMINLTLITWLIYHQFFNQYVNFQIERNIWIIKMCLRIHCASGGFFWNEYLMPNGQSNGLIKMKRMCTYLFCLKHPSLRFPLVGLNRDLLSVSSHWKLYMDLYRFCVWF